MPDTPVLPRDASGNVPKWVVYGGALAGVVGLVVLLRKQQSGTTGSTVAAGTSINAALGSLQEQTLNIQGDLSKVQAAQSQQIATDTSRYVIARDTAAQQADLTTARFVYSRDLAYNLARDPHYGYILNGTDPTMSAEAAHLATASTGTH